MSYFLTWLALMGLLALTLGTSFVSMGPWNSVVNLLIAAAKALLVALFFMHLRHAANTVRIAAVVGLVWLALLFGLSWSDMATRTIAPAPWESHHRP